MQEGIEALDNLQQKLQTAKKDAASLTDQYKRFSEGGEPPPSSSWMRSLGLKQQKDKQTQLQEMQVELEQKTAEARSAEEFYMAAWTLTIKIEIESFLKTKKSVGFLANAAFSERFVRSAQESAAHWQGLQRNKYDALHNEDLKEFPW